MRQKTYQEHLRNPLMHYTLSHTAAAPVQGQTPFQKTLKIRVATKRSGISHSSTNCEKSRFFFILSSKQPYRRPYAFCISAAIFRAKKTKAIAAAARIAEPR